MELEQGEVDNIGCIDNLPGHELRLAEFVVVDTELNGLHPLGSLNAVVVAILGIHRLLTTGITILHEANIGKFAPDALQQLGVNLPLHVEDDDVVLGHTSIPHQVANDGQRHLWRGIGLVVTLTGTAVVQVDLDGNHFAFPVAALLQTAYLLVVVAEHLLPCLTAALGPCEPLQGGSEHLVASVGRGVLVKKPLLLIGIPSSRPPCSLWAAGHDHTTGENATGYADGLVAGTRFPMEVAG